MSFNGKIGFYIIGLAKKIFIYDLSKKKDNQKPVKYVFWNRVFIWIAYQTCKN